MKNYHLKSELEELPVPDVLTAGEEYDKTPFLATPGFLLPVPFKKEYSKLIFTKEILNCSDNLVQS